MVDYKLVKYCNMCKKKFVVPKSESKRWLCDDCDAKTAPKE